MHRCRDYNELQRRVRAVARRGVVAVEEAGVVWDYPFLVCRVTMHRHVPTVLLTAGMHGEEPAGVEAALQWLESADWKRWPVNWLILPCINPFGWERNQRRNKQRRDINRQFRGVADCPEANLVKKLVRSEQYLISVEFHEDSDGHGYYLYELRREPPFVGEKVVEAVRQVIPIHRGRVYDGNEATGAGLIRRDPQHASIAKRRRWPMAYYLFRYHTGHCLGSETPLHRPMHERVDAHLVTIKTALQHIL